MLPIMLHLIRRVCFCVRLLLESTSSWMRAKLHKRAFTQNTHSCFIKLSFFPEVILRFNYMQSIREKSNSILKLQANQETWIIHVSAVCSSMWLKKTPSLQFVLIFLGGRVFQEQTRLLQQHHLTGLCVMLWKSCTSYNFCAIFCTMLFVPFTRSF